MRSTELYIVRKRLPLSEASLIDYIQARYEFLIGPLPWMRLEKCSFEQVASLFKFSISSFYIFGSVRMPVCSLQKVKTCLLDHTNLCT